jgi:hypothetical protein
MDRSHNIVRVCQVGKHLDIFRYRRVDAVNVITTQKLFSWAVDEGDSVAL